MADPRRMSDDDRYELAQRAAVAVRSARPAMPLILGGLALLIAVVSLLWASADRAESERRLASETRRLDRVVSIEQSFAALAARRAQGAIGVQTPLPDLFSRIEQAAEAAGLEKPAFPRENNEVQQGVTDRRLTYTVRTPELDKVLKWIDLSMERVPGLEVHDIRLTIDAAPRPAGRAAARAGRDARSDGEGGTGGSGSWTVVLTLARWERQP